MAARLKKKTACKPRTALAYGRAVKKKKKKKRVNLEPPRPMAARLTNKKIRIFQIFYHDCIGHQCIHWWLR